jgi:hypothetical protein
VKDCKNDKRTGNNAFKSVIKEIAENYTKKKNINRSRDKRKHFVPDLLILLDSIFGPLLLGVPVSFFCVGCLYGFSSNIGLLLAQVFCLIAASGCFLVFFLGFFLEEFGVRSFIIRRVCFFVLTAGFMFSFCFLKKLG